jgi:3',5'-cyclic AMP phosphodiesterase CpdA
MIRIVFRGKYLLLFIAMVLLLQACIERSEENSFSFVFMTDMHIQPERDGLEGFTEAIRAVNDLNPDFVITGGDLVMDAMGVKYSRADSLFNLYAELVKDLNMPVYNTMGNHDIYGIYSASGADPLHNEYGEKMFENRLGETYYSFSYQGWKFFILNSVEDTHRDRYIGYIDSTQMDWIKDELEKTDTITPVVISTHIPFITVNAQKYIRPTAANDSSSVIVNGREVLDLFSNHNLKLVLQGHMHFVEDIFIDGINFITGGAVSASWWQGPYRDDEEGFMLFSVREEEFEWRYVDYGWEVEQ